MTIFPLYQWVDLNYSSGAGFLLKVYQWYRLAKRQYTGSSVCFESPCDWGIQVLREMRNQKRTASRAWLYPLVVLRSSQSELKELEQPSRACSTYSAPMVLGLPSRDWCAMQRSGVFFKTYGRWELLLPSVTQFTVIVCTPVILFQSLPLATTVLRAIMLIRAVAIRKAIK